MALLELKGQIKAIFPVELVGKENQLRKQVIILKVPARRDDWGDVKGEEEEWSIDIMNANIDNLALNAVEHLDKNVICKCFLNSKKVVDGARTFYIINCTLWKTEFKV